MNRRFFGRKASGLLAALGFGAATKAKADVIEEAKPNTGTLRVRIVGVSFQFLFDTDMAGVKYEIEYPDGQKVKRSDVISLAPSPAHELHIGRGCNDGYAHLGFDGRRVFITAIQKDSGGESCDIRYLIRWPDWKTKLEGTMNVHVNGVGESILIPIHGAKA
jgi:hypothetical protein